MITLRRLAAFLMVVLLAAAWPLIATVFEAPCPAAGAWLVGAAAVLALIACIGLSDPTDRNGDRHRDGAKVPVTVSFLIALAAVGAAILMPWPARPAFAVLAAGIVLAVASRRRTVGHNIAAGVILLAVVWLAQALVLPAAERLMASTDGLPVDRKSVV